MKNPYQTQIATIIDIKEEGSDSKLFTLKTKEDFYFSVGQFVQVSLPGFGEAPFSICSDPHKKKTFQICVRRVGEVTSCLHKLRKKAQVGLRGPYGRGFPMNLAQKRNLLLIVGGLGIEPLRPLILEIGQAPRKFKKVQLFYGARSQSDLLFKKEYKTWKKNISLSLCLDQRPVSDFEWKCEVGVVTTLFDKVPLQKNPIAFLCGPPVMYKFVIQKLEELGVAPPDIYLSLERRMHCGIGVCQHCAVGSFYTCKDGPVFSWQELREIPPLF